MEKVVPRGRRTTSGLVDPFWGRHPNVGLSQRGCLNAAGIRWSGAEGEEQRSEDSVERHRRSALYETGLPSHASEEEPGEGPEQK